MKIKTKRLRLIILLISILITNQALGATPLASAAENYYIVKTGDNLWSIAQRYSMTVNSLKELNGLRGNVIFPDQRIKVLPVTATDNTTYVVKPGDSLWKISKRFNISLSLIRSLNNINGNLIHPNQRLLLPTRGVEPNQSAIVFRQLENNHPRERANPSDNNKELYWLARAISAEARGEPFEGQVAVGAVILNRVSHSRFPNTIYEVVFERTKGGVYQFSPVKDGSIYRQPTKEAINAANAALNGLDPTQGALFFYNPALTSRSNWIRSRPVAKVMNNHVFTL